MNHIFVIKDFIATKESAKHIMSDQIDVIFSAAVDINISSVKVFVNDINTKFYDKNQYSGKPIEFIPVLQESKKGKNILKHTFGGFHNVIINSITKDISLKNTLIHIQDGTLNLANIPSERGICKTRLGEMVNDILEMMRLLDYPVWFNTASDKGNMKFGHYYTMIDLLNLDESCLFESIPICIMYSGNSNLDWIMINCEEYKNKKMPSLMMNSDYDYDFLSIKQLIAKFANWGNGYFDTMFATVPTEVGAYFRNSEFDKDLQQYDMSKYKENIENYRNNLLEYKNLKQISVSDVIIYVRNKILSKLSNNDLKKLHNFENSLIQSME